MLPIPTESFKSIAIEFAGPFNPSQWRDMALVHQQKLILRLMRGRCVLTRVLRFLRPLRPVRPDLRRGAP